VGSSRSWKSLVAAAVACAGGGFGAGAEPGCEGPLAGPDSYANRTVQYVWASTRWDPDGSGPEREWIVFGGKVTDSIESDQVPVWRWDGQRLRSVGDATAMANMQLSSLTVWNDRLVAMSGTTTRPQAFVLNEGVWTPLPTNLTAGTANRLISYRGELVVAGLNFQINGAVSSVMVYRDGKWLPLGPPISGMCNDLIEFEGQLVVCGRTGNPSVRPFILRWDGVEWKTMGATWRGSEVKRLTVFDGRLVAVGSMTGAGSRDFLNAAVWNGSEWLGMGYPDPSGLVHVATHDDVLYATSFRSLWRWDRQRWTRVEPPGSFLSKATMLGSFDGDLLLFGSGVVSGSKDLPVARLIDGKFRSWEGAAGVLSGRAIMLGAIYQSKLVAAGPFSDIAGTKATGLGVWDGVSWESIGTGLVGGAWPLGLQAFSRGLIVIGDFGGVIDPTTGATVPTKGVARWDGERWHPFDAGLPIAPRSLGLDGDHPVVAVDVIGASPPRARIMRWVTDQWISIGELPGQAFETRIAALDGVIVVAGARRNDSGIQIGNYVARWDGEQWTYLLDELSTRTVWRLGFHAGQLYLTGSFSTIGGEAIWSLARWDGASWKPVGQGPGFYATCLLSTDDGSLLVGGFEPSGARVSRWDGENWTAIDIGPVSADSYVFDLMKYQGELVALGTFPFASLGIEPLATRRINMGGGAWIAWQPKGMEIVCGGSTTLRARVANGYVVASATWFRDGVPVVADRVVGVRVEFEGGHAVLRLDDVSSDVAGTYHCVFETACGVLESDPAVVAVTGTCCPGDLTLDGVVDDADFMAFAQSYFTMTCESAKMRPGCAADLDSDGLVGDTDFEVFALAYDAFVCPG
jgi:hypothetical protein